MKKLAKINFDMLTLLTSEINVVTFRLPGNTAIDTKMSNDDVKPDDFI